MIFYKICHSKRLKSRNLKNFYIDRLFKKTHFILVLSKNFPKYFVKTFIISIPILSIFLSTCEIKLPEPPPDIFYKHITLNSLDGPSDLLAQDLNLDGNLDIAIVNMRKNKGTLFLGRGDGSFLNRIEKKVYAEPSTVISEDLNHDGFPDLIFNSRANNALTLLFTNGKKGYKYLKSLKTGRVPIGLIKGDFNNDKKMDIAVTLSSNKMEIYFGAGNGKLEHGPTYNTGSRSESGVTSDFNEDSNLDIALATNSPNASAIRIYLGLGNGTFHKSMRIAKGERPITIATRDMNADNHMDLLATTGKQDNLIFLSGKGDGTFHPPIKFSGGGGPNDITINYFNKDNLLDVAVTNSRSSSFSIIYQSSNGGFSYPSLDYIVSGGTPIAIASGDFNNDRRADIAVSSDAKNSVEIYLQKEEK